MHVVGQRDVDGIYDIAAQHLLVIGEVVEVTVATVFGARLLGIAAGDGAQAAIEALVDGGCEVVTADFGVAEYAPAYWLVWHWGLWVWLWGGIGGIIFGLGWGGGW